MSDVRAPIVAGLPGGTLETREPQAHTARPLVQRNGNVLDARCPDDIGTMRSDPTKLRQVLLNLRSNTSKFTEQGQISLAVSRSPGREHVVFEVRDTGMGMTPSSRRSSSSPSRYPRPPHPHRTGRGDVSGNRLQCR